MRRNHRKITRKKLTRAERRVLRIEQVRKIAERITR